MQELIAVNYDGEYPSVSGRELHEALEIDRPYTMWIERMLEYGFVAEKDYLLVEQICETNNPKNPMTQRSEHMLSVSMAKELCTLQRSEKGKQFRKYFIKCEDAWNSPEKIMERALYIARIRAADAEERIFALANENDALSAEIETLTDENEALETALNESIKYYTVAKYNKTFNMQWTMKESQTIGRKLSVYCKAHNIEKKQCETNDERFSAVKSYPASAWESVLQSAPDLIKTQEQI